MRDLSGVRGFVERLWQDEIIDELQRYIRIPNKSPAFDSQWQHHGYMDQAVELMVAWAKRQLAAIPGATINVVRLPGRTPVITIVIPGRKTDSVLLYGHLDKQPEISDWSPGLGPWEPVLRGDRLYGRGAADDGYALFGALSAILALRAHNIPHARCVILIEACEESGSYDLPFYLENLHDLLSTTSLVICLDSFCGTYDRLWLTTSLRGLLGGVLSIRVLDEASHSGDASGIVPSSFRILRNLLSRLEDDETGRILPKELCATIPDNRVSEAVLAAAVLGDQAYCRFPFAQGVLPVTSEVQELLLNRAWRPQLAVIGAGSLPPIGDGGNVLRPKTDLQLSIRLPPTVDAREAGMLVKNLVERDAPYASNVVFNVDCAANGWNSPPTAEWLSAAIEYGSQCAFGKSASFIGEGGTIPFLGMFAEALPQAQFVVTGVLGPGSNAHGPNEFLHLPSAQRVSLAVACIIAEHYIHN